MRNEMTIVLFGLPYGFARFFALAGASGDLPGPLIGQTGCSEGAYLAYCLAGALVRSVLSAPSEQSHLVAVGVIWWPLSLCYPDPGQVDRGAGHTRRRRSP